MTPDVYDLIILTCIIGSSIWGYYNGGVIQVSYLAACFLGKLVADHFYLDVASALQWSGDLVMERLAYYILLIVVVIIAIMIANRFNDVVMKSLLKFVNQLFGFVLGLIIAVYLCSYLTCCSLNDKEMGPIVSESRAAKYLPLEKGKHLENLFFQIETKE
ncbi:MAG: CvpA family protein [Thermoguttaceae bacterium]|nr:CvpA family protein [Thermoguttaceae bacterium]